MEKTIFSCPLCNRVFKLKHHLKAHLQKKNPCITKKEKYSRKGDISKKNNKILNKILNNNSIITRHVCEFCNKSYKHRFNLNKHLKRCQKKKRKR